MNVKGTLAVIRKFQLDSKINISDLDILYEQIRIVLAFHDPEIRKLTEFAVA